MSRRCAGPCGSAVTAVTILSQTLVPKALLGRFGAAYRTTTLTSMTVGAVVVNTTAHATGSRVTLAGWAALTAVLVIALGRRLVTMSLAP